MAKDEWKSFTVRVPTALYRQLVKVAERELSSLNRETNIALRSHLDYEARGRK